MTRISEPGPPRYRILVVDDDDQDRILLRRALRRMRLDWELIEVGSARQARRALSATRFDCALLDFHLPDGSGLQLIRDMGAVPAIILTGIDDTESAEIALHQGAQDYLVKGKLDGRSLSRAVRYAIERKQGELLRMQLHHAERLASLGGLAASVAHEVNNPASFVMANLLAIREQLSSLGDLLTTFADSDPARMAELAASNMRTLQSGPECIEMVDESIEGMRRITSIVRQMQTFSRTESEEEPVAPVSLNKVAEWACLLTWPQVKHHARLEKDLDPALPLIPGHQARLSQVVTNLLVNAAQAIPEGSADVNAVRITTRAVPDGVELEITDTGSGIPEELRARVVEPFFTTKPVGEGTGLGLAVSLEIIRGHQGELHIEDHDPRGTRIRVFFPRNTGLVPTMPLARVTPIEEPISMKILLIDDEPAVARAYQRLLRDHDVTAGDVHSAIDALREDSAYDAVVCDIMMPEIDGPAFYEFVATHFPHLVDRIVFLTGGVFTERVRGFVERVEGRVVSKPASRERLLEVLGHLRRGERPRPLPSDARVV